MYTVTPWCPRYSSSSYKNREVPQKWKAAPRKSRRMKQVSSKGGHSRTVACSRTACLPGASLEEKLDSRVQVASVRTLKSSPCQGNQLLPSIVKVNTTYDFILKLCDYITMPIGFLPGCCPRRCACSFSLHHFIVFKCLNEREKILLPWLSIDLSNNFCIFS